MPTDDPIKVLLVPTVPLEAAGLVEMMRVLGLEVLDVLEESPKVVEAAARTRPDVVLIDAETSGIDAAWAARRVREELGIPMILLSAIGDPDWIDRNVEAGAYHILIKPFTGDDLYAEIRGVLAEREDRLRWESDRRTIEQAKGLLMHRCQVSEQEAYARLRRQSMILHRSLPDLARDIIAAADLLFWTPPGGRP